MEDFGSPVIRDGATAKRQREDDAADTRTKLPRASSPPAEVDAAEEGELIEAAVEGEEAWAGPLDGGALQVGPWWSNTARDVATGTCPRWLECN
jgi:hypothetical protein